MQQPAHYRVNSSTSALSYGTPIAPSLPLRRDSLRFLTHGFPQAPYIPISQREYEVAAARLLPLDLRGVGHEVDEKYCTGEVCEVKR